MKLDMKLLHHAKEWARFDEGGLVDMSELIDRLLYSSNI